MFTKAIETKNQIYLPDYKMGQNSNLNSSCKVSFMLQKYLESESNIFFYIILFHISHANKLSSVQTVRDK